MPVISCGPSEAGLRVFTRIPVAFREMRTVNKTKSKALEGSFSLASMQRDFIHFPLLSFLPHHAAMDSSKLIATHLSQSVSQETV